MFGDGSLTFREFAMREPHPLAVIHDAVLEFLRDRTDAVLFGAQAVNAYVTEVADDTGRGHCLHARRRIGGGIASLPSQAFPYCRARRGKLEAESAIASTRCSKPENRHLIDVRPVAELPPAQLVQNVLVVTPPELIANKMCSMIGRGHKPKGFQDQADLYRLLLRSLN